MSIQQTRLKTSFTPQRYEPASDGSWSLRTPAKIDVINWLAKNTIPSQFLDLTRDLFILTHLVVDDVSLNAFAIVFILTLTQLRSHGLRACSCL
jgi:hypothetical protein